MMLRSFESRIAGSPFDHAGRVGISPGFGSPGRSGPAGSDERHHGGAAQDGGADGEGALIAAAVEQQATAEAPRVMASWMAATISPPPASASSGRVRLSQVHQATGAAVPMKPHRASSTPVAGERSDGDQGEGDRGHGRAAWRRAPHTAGSSSDEADEVRAQEPHAQARAGSAKGSER